jgi:hypothetical protein
MWESEVFPDLFPLAIPYHGGKDISPGVQRTILNQMDEDVLRWEEVLDASEHNDDDEDETADNGSCGEPQDDTG